MTETLLNVPIELAGNWGHMVPGAAKLVVERMRQVCLGGVRLVSDRQPRSLRIDEHTFGPPAMWLHSDPVDVAWIIVDIGPQDWSKLAYQFGHELGHVMANSWRRDDKPGPPCQWLEEAMVEAFSIRGLAALAARWKQDPPFPNDNPFGDAIAAYRQTILQGYGRLGQDQGVGDFAAWFANHRADIEAQALGLYARAASLTVLAEYERFPDCVEGLGALNRWPGRTGVAIADYLRFWESSCHDLQASPHLPVRLRELLRVR